MRKNLDTEIRVGIFVTVGVGLIMLSMLLFDDNHSLLSGQSPYTAHFDRVDGLITGSKVVLNGVPVGMVESILLDAEKQDISVHFSLTKSYTSWIRKGSTVEIATQGVLGDKYISITPGPVSEPVLPPNSDLPNVPSKDLGQLLSKGDNLMVSLNSIALNLDHILQTFDANNKNGSFFKELAVAGQNLAMLTDKVNQSISGKQIKEALTHLERIMEKVDNGTGSIGALINDPSLYDQLKALLGGANRNRIIRNLVRQTIRESNEANEAPDTSTKK